MWTVPSRCVEDLLTPSRQLGQRNRRFQLRRLLRRLWMQHRIREPISQIPSAAGLALRRWRLRLAFAAARRALDPDMEVIVVAVHRPHLGQPAAVALGFAAQRFFYRGVDEDA